MKNFVNKNFLILCALVFLFIVNGTSQETKFHIKYSSSDGSNQKINGSLKVSDGFLLVGTKSSSDGYEDVLTMKTNVLGSVLWSKTYGGDKDNSANSITATTDGGYIIAGFTKSYKTVDIDSNNIFLMKFDSNDNLEWSKIIGGIGLDVATSIKETQDEGLIVCGYTKSNETSEEDILVVRIDKSGNLLWHNVFGTTSKDEATSIIETKNGSFIVIGHSNGFGTGTLTYITKLDTFGVIEWSKYYDFSTHTDDKKRLSFDIIENSDGDFMIFGALGLGFIGDGSPFLLKINTNGDVISAYSYLLNSGNGGATSVKQTPDGGYILAGYMGSFSALVKVNENGERDWSTCYWYTGITESKILSVEVDNNGYFLFGYQNESGLYSSYGLKTNLSGTTDCDYCSTTGTGTEYPNVSFNNASTNIYAIALYDSIVSPSSKNITTTASIYCSVVGIEDYTILSPRIYPNPFTDNTVITFESPLKDNVKIEIYNSIGLKVEESINISSNNEIIVYRNQLSQGVYIIHLSEKDRKIYSGKIVIID